MRWEEYPPTLRVIRAVAAIPLYVALLGIGIAALLMGDTTGRIVGAVLVAGCVGIAIRVATWRADNRSAKPSS
jgi:hypothetical protein